METQPCARAAVPVRALHARQAEQRHGCKGYHAPASIRSGHRFNRKLGRFAPSLAQHVVINKRLLNQEAL